MGGTLRVRDLIEHRHRVAGVIDEQPLPGRVRLAHRRRDDFAPFAIEFAEAAVTVAVHLLRAVLLPQQHQVMLRRFISSWTWRQSIAGRGAAVSPETGNSRRSSSA